MYRLGVYLLLLLFLQSKVGLALNIHYCGAHIAKISWAFDAKGCGMEQKQTTDDTLQFNQKTCCEDDVIIAQNDGDQNSGWSQQFFINGIHLAVSSFSAYNETRSERVVYCLSRPPPKQALYKLNGAFLFYG